MEDADVRELCMLHLKGVTFADFEPIEDEFDNRLKEEVTFSEKPSNPIPFDEIPSVFTSLDLWPPSTNLKCWSCDCTFDGMPKFAPTYVREADTDSGYEIGVEGNFCTFNCAALHIDTMYPPQAYPDKHWKMRDQLCLVYRIFTGAVSIRAPAWGRTGFCLTGALI